jgi:DNA-binding NarL/FixJ family response regulator
VKYTQREIDEEAVQTVVAGGRAYLSPASRHEAIRRLARMGKPRPEIAVQLRCSVETVDRAAKGILVKQKEVPEWRL